ncbi:MAG: hypothetical protein ACE5JK_07900, partial [Candidatus Omnitrophota bacterium]
VATESKIGTAEAPQQDFMSTVRVLAVPDVDEKLVKGGRNLGWFFTRETIGAALLLSLVSADDILFDRGFDTPASDLQRFMRQALRREVNRRDLCYMLSYEEIKDVISRAQARWPDEDKIPRWFKEIQDTFEGGIATWLALLVKRVLLDMPIEAYDTNRHLRERQENIFKAIRAV